MKFIYVLAFFSITTLYGMDWYTDLGQAKRVAVKENKILLVYFWASHSGPCQKMDANVWMNSEVNRLGENFVCVKVDVEKELDVIKQYPVLLVPTVVFMDAGGKLISESAIYRDSEWAIQMMSLYAMNTSFMHMEMENYLKADIFSTSYRLSKKYLDFSLVVKKELFEMILNIADMYIQETKKKCKDLPNNIKEKFALKVEFLEMYSDLYRGNYNKVYRKVSQINEDEISKLDKDALCFLHYCAAYGLKRDNEATVYFDKLKETKNYDSYKSRIDHLFNH